MNEIVSGIIYLTTESGGENKPSILYMTEEGFWTPFVEGGFDTRVSLRPIVGKRENISTVMALSDKWELKPTMVADIVVRNPIGSVEFSGGVQLIRELLK